MVCGFLSQHHHHAPAAHTHEHTSHISSTHTHTHTHTCIEQKRVCVGVCVSLKARQCFSSRAGSECFGVIRGVCSILPEGSAAWRIKSPTCLCFSDLCCPGNRCREFPFLHFFFFLYTIHITPHHHHHQRRRHHHLYTPHAAAAAAVAAASSPTTCRIVQSHTHTHTHTHTHSRFTHNFQSTAVISQCHRTDWLLLDITTHKAWECAALTLCRLSGWTTIRADNLTSSRRNNNNNKKKKKEEEGRWGGGGWRRQRGNNWNQGLAVVKTKLAALSDLRMWLISLLYFFWCGRR